MQLQPRSPARLIPVSTALIVQFDWVQPNSCAPPYFLQQVPYNDVRPMNVEYTECRTLYWLSKRLEVLRIF